MTNCNLSGADLRGAIGAGLGSAITTNTILPDGTIQGLHLDSNNPALLVRNYSGNIPIQVLGGMSMTAGTSLVFQLDDASWGSMISFASGIPVTLGGSLELGVAGGVNPAGLLGDSFQLFDWAGVSPSGRFSQVINDLPAGYSWNTSQLYTLGEVVLASCIPGDANGDGQVDVNDLTIVLSHFGQTGMTWGQGEFTGDGTVDVNDLTIVLANFGQAPARRG